MKDWLLKILITKIPILMKKSWKTTIVGIAAAIGIIAHQVVALLDGDPATTFNLDAIIAALAAFGIGIAARDNDVSSEKAGAK